MVQTKFNSPHFVVVDKAAYAHNIRHQNIDVTPLIMAFDIMHSKIITQRRLLDADIGIGIKSFAEAK